VAREVARFVSGTRQDNDCCCDQQSVIAIGCRLNCSNKSGSPIFFGSHSLFDTTMNFATVVTISGLGVVLYSIINMVEARVTYKRDAAK
jgi:hypothetical protein